MELAPIPKFKRMVEISGMLLPKADNNKYQQLMASRPRPTTIRPITAPLWKATRRPSSRLFWAALAVLLLAMVAVVIPINPAKPEQKPPVKKARGTMKDPRDPPPAKPRARR